MKTVFDIMKKEKMGKQKIMYLIDCEGVAMTSELPQQIHHNKD